MSTLQTLRDTRIEKLKKLRELGINPYPADSKKEYSNTEIGNNFEKYEGKSVTLTGRIMSWREHGNVIFAHIQDQSGTIQVFIQKNELNIETNSKDQAIGFKELKLLDIGDFIEVTGKVLKTTKGEISVVPNKIKILSKSLRPLPEKWEGIQDTETRFRKRYLDLIFNSEIRERFMTRTKLVREVRRYLDNLGYWEVETPTLQNQYGGANAKPFKTHLNALDIDMYLRIADELYLKRLVVGGYEKVYEICKDFRNEGVDLTHNPEFTMIEYYEAYADYQKVMDVTEGLFKHLAKTIFGDTKLKVGEKTVDIGKDWPRIKMVDILKEKLGLDVDKESEESLLSFCKKNKIEILGGETKGQLIYTIFEHRATDLLIEPTWVIDYPKDVSPLSKNHRDKEGWVERFEGYIGGKEICDGWSELTDPQEQRERFETDTKVVRKDKDEAQKVDEDFLEAMEYGMPPIGGIGIGIDRLTMFFTNTWSIKEVILYPMMRPENK